MCWVYCKSKSEATCMLPLQEWGEEETMLPLIGATGYHASSTRYSKKKPCFLYQILVRVNHAFSTRLEQQETMLPLKDLARRNHASFKRFSKRKPCFLYQILVKVNHLQD